MKAPDYHAPRVRALKVNIFDKPTIARLKKKRKSYGKYSFAIFNSIIDTFHEEVIAEVQRNRYGVILPLNLGCIAGIRIKSNNLKCTDMNASIKAGKRVFYRQYETDNNVLKIVFLNNLKRCMVRNHAFLSFIPSRIFKKALSTHFVKHWNSYLTDKARIVI